MSSEEASRLINNVPSSDYKYNNIQSNNGSGLAKRGHGRTLSGTEMFGSFRFRDGPGEGSITGLKRTFSISADGRPSYEITPRNLGKQELYADVPFTAVFGMQNIERKFSEAFALSAAEFDVMGQGTKLTEEEKMSRMSHASMIILDELDFDAKVVTMPLIFAILVAAASQFLVGYNTGVMNAPAAIVFPGHSTLLWSLAVAVFAIGGPFGSYAAGKLADQRGRRGAIMFCTWTFLVGGILQSFAVDMVSIIIARLIIGFASGFSTVIIPIYLGEMAPPTLRGLLGTVTQFAMVIGILIANLIAFPTVPKGNWRALFAVTPAVAILQLMLAPFVLESPRWLLGRDPSSIKARYIIKNLRGLRLDHEIEAEVGNFVIGCEAQKQENSSQMDVLRDMWEKPKVRKLLISSLILQLSQQLSGINAVFYYSTSFFEGVIDSPLLGTTIVCAVNVLATYAVLFLMDRCGRRTLILWSSGGMLLSCVALVLSLKGFLNNIVALLAVNVYVMFFEFGLGPIPWLIVAEMFEGKYVSVAMSVSSQLNWVCNFIVGLVFPYFVLYLGPYSFVPFACVLAGCFVFTATILPETQGTTPEQLVAEMKRTLSQTVIYQPPAESIQRIDLEWQKAMEQIQQEETAAQVEGTYNYGSTTVVGSYIG